MWAFTLRPSLTPCLKICRQCCTTTECPEELLQKEGPSHAESSSCGHPWKGNFFPDPASVAPPGPSSGACLISELTDQNWSRNGKPRVLFCLVLLQGAGFRGP